MHWSWLSLLYPFIYIRSHSRRDAFSSVFYYAAATWSVIPGSRTFFGSDAGPLLSLALWLAVVSLGSLPWIALYYRRCLDVSAVISLVVLALPPLSLVTEAYPLVSAGQWFPGTRWFGLAVPLLLVVLYRSIRPRYVAAILIAAVLVTHVGWRTPVPDPHIVTINTHFGGSAFIPRPTTLLYEQQLYIQEQALLHPDSIVLLPETVVPTWSRMTDRQWHPAFRQLERQHTTLLLGTTVPIPNSEADRNILLARGFGKHFAYVQRVPVPVAMWQFGDRQHGYPLMLKFPPTVRVMNQRAAVLICYEQLLVWPALQSLARNPDFLLAPSNDYWGSNTAIPAIQHESARNWADLWGIPLYEARNE